jgi:Flp pilus assembly protein TadG
MAPLRSFLSSIRRFRRNENGVTAIEFAFICPCFFALMIAIIEVAICFFFQQVLETATADASRMIMTGQVKAASMTKAQFHQQVCNRLPPLFDCMNKVTVDVQVVPKFGGSSIQPLLTGGVLTSNNNAGYNPGVGGDIVIVRVGFLQTVWCNLLQPHLGNANGGKDVLLQGTSTFRNEPFL